MKIDLTKKPEGATHINPHSGLWIKCFGGNSGSYQFFKDGEWEMGFGCMSNSYLEIAQPEPWTGEGLPPVGMVCEAMLPSMNHQWAEAVVVWHHPEHEDSAVVVHNGGRLTGWSSAFRPIRTPEQIAAEEREKAIAEMVYGGCGCDQSDGTTTAFVICRLLYDAGYRKQVSE